MIRTTLEGIVEIIEHYSWYYWAEIKEVLITIGFGCLVAWLLITEDFWVHPRHAMQFPTLALIHDIGSILIIGGLLTLVVLFLRLAHRVGSDTHG